MAGLFLRLTRGIETTTRLQPTDFALASTKSGRVISDQIVNKHGLGGHSVGFLIPNEDPLSVSRPHRGWALEVYCNT